MIHGLPVCVCVCVCVRERERERESSKIYFYNVKMNIADTQNRFYSHYIILTITYDIVSINRSSAML